MRFRKTVCEGRTTDLYRVVAYVYGTPSTMNVAELTNVNYAFGHIVNNKIFISNGDEISRLVSFKTYNPDLRIIISIGGWGADGFSDAAYSVESRETFANSCLNILNIYGLDGIDIDWEYPVSGACGLIKCRPEDKYNFTLLLQSVRDKIGNNKILSVAAGSDRFYIDNVEIDKIVNIINYINLMTYDFGQGTHISNLYHTSSGYDPGISCDESVNMYLNAGVPANKINLGIPFFGYYNNHSLSYYTLVNDYINKNGWIRYWDDEAKAAYLKNDSSFITYEDEESIGYKANYIKAKGLGGAMFWEYNQDYNSMLLNALWTDLNKNN